MTGGPVHPGDLLSAYADGELAVDERAAVDVHLGGCAACRQELEATHRAKAWLSDLPAVEVPFGFLERMLADPSQPRRRRDRWMIRAGSIGLAATASIWLAVVGLTGLTGDRSGGVPALNSLVSLHEEPPPPPDTPADQTAARAAALGLPASMGAYHLASVTDPLAESGRPRQVTYERGGERLSAFVFVGYDIVEARLPAAASELLVRGEPAWAVRVDGSLVVLAQVGSNAVVLVDADPAPTVAEDLRPHSPDPSLMDRVRGAGEGLLEAFGLG
jgi:hypothetical protein